MQAYAEDAFADLLGRFEAPIATNRWDAPLFTIDTAVDNDEQIRAVLASVVRYISSEGGHSGAALAGRDPDACKMAVGDLQPNVATRSAAPRGAAWLQETDGAAQAVVQWLTSAQAAVGPGLALGCVQVLARPRVLL